MADPTDKLPRGMPQLTVMPPRKQKQTDGFFAMPLGGWDMTFLTAKVIFKASVSFNTGILASNRRPERPIG